MSTSFFTSPTEVALLLLLAANLPQNLPGASVIAAAETNTPVHSRQAARLIMEPDTVYVGAW